MHGVREGHCRSEGPSFVVPTQRQERPLFSYLHTPRKLRLALIFWEDLICLRLSAGRASCLALCTCPAAPLDAAASASGGQVASKLATRISVFTKHCLTSWHLTKNALLIGLLTH